MRSFWIRVLAVLAVLALALPAFAWSNGRFLCQMTGHLGTACCCAKAHAKSAERAVPAVDQKSCCERVDVGAPVLAPTPSELKSGGSVYLLTPAVAFEGVELPHIAQLAAPRLARGPPPGVALFIVNCALLI